MSEARAAREAFEVVRARLEAARADWLVLARSHAERLGRGGRVVTVNDVREAVPLPEGIDPRVFGVVFKPKEWECLGYHPSTRKACHGRPIGHFRLKHSR